MKQGFLYTTTLVFFLLTSNLGFSQEVADSTQINKEYTDIEEAMKEPDKVYRLNLSEHVFKDSQIHLSQFRNLQYLSLRNDHLKILPKEIATLQNLRVLDLSGNDFKVLPSEIIGLKNLEELYLNDDKKLNLKKNFDVLGTLPKLKSLHLEHDGFKKLPPNINKLSHLENLYLNDNKLRVIPIEIKDLKHLGYLRLNHNLFNDKKNEEYKNFGVRIKF